MLRACEAGFRCSEEEKQKVLAFLVGMVPREYLGLWNGQVERWARVQLPNGQIARTLWKEGGQQARRVRMACRVKVGKIISCLSRLANLFILLQFQATTGGFGYAEVHYFARISTHHGPLTAINQHFFAIASAFTNYSYHPESSGALLTCQPPDGNQSLIILSVQSLVCVVAVIPRPRFQDLFILEKPKATLVEGEEEEDTEELAAVM